MGVNFFLTEADVGLPRATVCAPRIQELNDLVKVSVHRGPLDEDIVSAQDVLVMTTTNRDELIRWNNYCRTRRSVTRDNRGRLIESASPIRFICAGSFGAMGYVFSDFGPDFIVADKNGEPPVQRVITNITNANEGIVSLLEPTESELAKKMDIADNEHEGFVSFQEVQGMHCKEESALKAWGDSINTSGVWRISEVWNLTPDYLIVPKDKGGDGERRDTQVWVRIRDPKTGQYVVDKERPDGLARQPKFSCECSDIPEEDFVRDELGNKQLRMTQVKDHYKVKIGDTTNYSEYIRGGLLQQVYQPVTLHHRSLVDTYQQPVYSTPLMGIDGEKGELGWWYPMLHLLSQSVLQFQLLHKRAPTPNHEPDADEIVRLATQLNGALRDLQYFLGPHAATTTLDLTRTARKPPTAEGLTQHQLEAVERLKAMGASEQRALLALEAGNYDEDEALMICLDEDRVRDLEAAVDTYKCLEAMKRLALVAGSEFQPLSVFLGGVCAQEVVKHCGKFTPLDQWLLFDCIEVLPTTPLPKHETDPQDTRYDHNIALFGVSVQRRLMAVKTFMVGCGALGCELLKNFALLGVACGSNGWLTVTDGDRIEVSNLNRQFLFRKQHVKKPKSVTAAWAAKNMNPDVRIQALELLASPETEKVFCDDFWLQTGVPNVSGESSTGQAVGEGHGLDFVVNALDNVKARKYVDSRCVFFRKPLLESGTEGTKFNHMVILPHQTVSYDEGEADAPEGEAIPMCTLRNFPSTIVHCIEWARGLFEDLFVTPVAGLQDFLKDSRLFISDIRERAESYSYDANELSQLLTKLRDQEGNGLLLSAEDALNVKRNGLAACVQIAYRIFTQKFDHAMRDLQHQFPKDMSVNGKPFWAPPKR